jgi:hypothetical protein
MAHERHIQARLSMFLPFYDHRSATISFVTQETHMSKLTIRSGLATAALASAFAAIAFMAPEASASTTSKLLKCKGATASKVIACCEQQIKKAGERPWWFVSQGNSCSKMKIACSYTSSTLPAITYVAAPKKKKICYLVLPDGAGGSDKKKETQDDDNRKQ